MHEARGWQGAGGMEATRMIQFRTPYVPCSTATQPRDLVAGLGYDGQWDHATVGCCSTVYVCMYIMYTGNPLVSVDAAARAATVSSGSGSARRNGAKMVSELALPAGTLKSPKS